MPAIRLRRIQNSASAAKTATADADIASPTWPKRADMRDAIR